MRRRASLYLTLTAAVLAIPAPISTAVAEVREHPIMKHGEQMIELLTCGHFAKVAFGYEKSQPFFVRGMEEGRTFHEGMFSKEYEPEEIETLLSFQLSSSIIGVSPEFSLGYTYANLEIAAYDRMTEGGDLESTANEDLKKTARELFASAECEARKP